MGRHADRDHVELLHQSSLRLGIVHFEAKDVHSLLRPESIYRHDRAAIGHQLRAVVLHHDRLCHHRHGSNESIREVRRRWRGNDPQLLWCEVLVQI